MLLVALNGVAIADLDHLATPTAYDNIGGPGVIYGQTFVAVDDTVGGVQFYIGDPTRPGNATVNQLSGISTVTLYQAANLSSPVQVAQASVPALQVGLGSVRSFPFASPVSVVSGTRYFIAVTSQDQFGIGMRHISASTYSQGAETSMDPVTGVISPYYSGRDLSFLVFSDRNAIGITPLPSYSHNPAIGAHGIQGISITELKKKFSFIFTADATGGICLVSWTPDFRSWFPLIDFSVEENGTQIEDGQAYDEFRSYRTAYLPTGVLPAGRFDYPIGDRGVNGGGTPTPQGVLEFPAAGYAERNNIFFRSPSGEYVYPVAEGNNPDRGQLSGTTTEWRNVQDVGSYLAGYGLHAGEDWNLGSGSYDAGQPVASIANGQVIDIRPANQSAGLSVWGWRMLIRHWLPNGDTVDSLYVHIAPDKFNGNDNSDGSIGSAGAESYFTFQEGAAVPRGAIIGVVGNITPPAPGAPHLHFEIRDTKTDPNDSWSRSNGNGYYGAVAIPGTMTPEEVQTAFNLMRQDGMLDPSDFIDDHRSNP